MQYVLQTRFQVIPPPRSLEREINRANGTCQEGCAIASEEQSLPIQTEPTLHHLIPGMTENPYSSNSVLSVKTLIIFGKNPGSPKTYRGDRSLDYKYPRNCRCGSAAVTPSIDKNMKSRLHRRTFTEVKER